MEHQRSFVFRNSTAEGQKMVKAKKQQQQQQQKPGKTKQNKKRGRRQNIICLPVQLFIFFFHLALEHARPVLEHDPMDVYTSQRYSYQAFGRRHTNVAPGSAKTPRLKSGLGREVVH